VIADRPAQDLTAATTAKLRTTSSPSGADSILRFASLSHCEIERTISWSCAMNPAVLCGREHTTLGAIAAIAEGRCAIAISCGGARKTYHHKDPNEDAATFVAGEGGVLVAVADGHGGCDASEVAVERLAERHAPGWTGREARGIEALWPTAARAAFADVHEAILRFAARGGAESSRTTLTFALIRPGDDLLALASMGDSHAFRVDGAGAVDLAHDAGTPPAFLGRPQETKETLREKCVLHASGLARVRALLLVTDGISERGIGVDEPEAAVLEAVERAGRAESQLRPLEAARTAVELALSAHRRNRAGDNVASAVVWL
jgi:serine/threonine protein phosphatase PrpC